MPLLSIENLSIRFGGILALNEVSFDQEQGHILSLIGPNGSGKTTVLNCITRAYEPSTGSIVFSGHDLLRMSAHDVIGVGIARTFQNLELFESMSVLENVMVGQHATIRTNLLDNAFALPKAWRAERQARRRAEEILEFLNLEQYRHAPASALPFGLKKRVELARALVSRPRLLLLDEPANGLSFSEAAELTNLVRLLRDEMKLSILLVEHHMGLVMNVSDWVCVLNFGHKIGEGTPRDVQENNEVIEAYLGEGQEAATPP